MLFFVQRTKNKNKPTYNFDSVASYNMSCEPPTTTSLTFRVRFSSSSTSIQAATNSHTRAVKTFQPFPTDLSPTATHLSPICPPRGMRHSCQTRRTYRPVIQSRCFGSHDRWSNITSCLLVGLVGWFGWFQTSCISVWHVAHKANMSAKKMSKLKWFLQCNPAVTKVSLGPKISRKNMTTAGPQEVIANHSRPSPNLHPSLKAIIWYGIVRILYGRGTSMAWHGRQYSNEAAKITGVRLSVLLERLISKQ